MAQDNNVSLPAFDAEVAESQPAADKAHRGEQCAKLSTHQADNHLRRWNER